MKKFLKKIKNLSKEDMKKFAKKHFYLLPLFILILTLTIMAGKHYIVDGEKVTEVSYLEFLEMVEKNTVDKISINFEETEFSFINTDKMKYKTTNPKSEDFKKIMLEKGIEVKEKENIVEKIMELIPTALSFLLTVMLFKSINSIGKSDATMVSEDNIPNLTLKDIAGHKEVKEDIAFIVDFLKEPSKYSEIGARLPKGAILYGPPGTGKTLIAKAIAGEAGVPFFYTSGSNFVEMFVGLGAKRVRKLFDDAKKKAPCIIFIDEIDAVGLKRGRDNNSERDQTINELLSQLDGFNGSEGVFVIAATNRIENLDEALIRAGRFDKHIAVGLPERDDRLEMFHIHGKNMKFSDNVSFDVFAKMTTGFSGAMIESLLNESAIIAAVNNSPYITQCHMDDAYYKIVMKGHAKKDSALTDEKTRKVIAWHEAGHALVARKYANREVTKVSIISSTSGAGGVTFITPLSTGILSKDDILKDIGILYAGRIAEEFLYENINLTTTGASQDIKEATKKIHLMINTYGMSKFGLLNVSEFGCKEKIFDEAENISRDVQTQITKFIHKNVGLLSKIADRLLENETISEIELDEIIQSFEKVAA